MRVDCNEVPECVPRLLVRCVLVAPPLVLWDGSNSDDFVELVREVVAARFDLRFLLSPVELMRAIFCLLPAAWLSNVVSLFASNSDSFLGREEANGADEVSLVLSVFLRPLCVRLLNWSELLFE